MTEGILPELGDLDVFDGIADELAAEAEAWLRDPTRTAHRLVSVPTAVLVAEALGGTPTPAPAPVVLPGGVWRVLPDRLLALRPHRRVQVTTAQHLALTALVLQQWGWARTGGRIRTRTGRRCILGAQAVVHHLGYGSDLTLADAGRQLDGALTARGIRLAYHEWNEQPHVTQQDALGLIRQAAGGAS